MNIKYIILAVLVLFSITNCTVESKETSIIIENADVIVKIAVGSSVGEFTTSWRENLTALEALQYVANVNTHPVAGKYVFVTKIDSVESERGKNAWYYTINGNKATKLAVNQMVEPGDTIQWNFKADVCSKTVDKEGCKD